MNDEPPRVTLRATERTPAAYRRYDGRSYPVDFGPWSMVGARGMLFGVPGLMVEPNVWEMTEPWPDQWGDEVVIRER